MSYDNSERRMIWVAILLLALGAVLLALSGCSSTATVCPEIEPTIKTKEVPKPYPVLVKIKPLDPLALEDYPEPPGHDADEAEWKSFAQEVKRIAEERGAKKDARIEALQQLIDDHNRLAVFTEPEGLPDPPP